MVTTTPPFWVIRCLILNSGAYDYSLCLETTNWAVAILEKRARGQLISKLEPTVSFEPCSILVDVAVVGSRAVEMFCLQTAPGPSAALGD